MPLLSSFSSAQFSSTQLGRGNAPLFSLCHELSLHLHESTKWSSKDSFDDPCLPTTVQRIEFHKVESTMDKKPTQSPLHTVASIDDAIARYHSITLLQQPTVFFFNLSKWYLDHQMLGWWDDGPSNPVYYSEDCQISSLIYKTLEKRWELSESERIVWHCKFMRVGCS